jgi:NADPH-dependent ferric siderophore reductase
MTRPFPLHTGIAAVTARTVVTPSMARFTLTHPTFADFGVEQPGEIITLGWCDEGEALVMPLLRWRFPPGTREQHWRNYTVRAYRPERAEVDIDFFLHGDLGIAAAWGEQAKPGDTVGFAGPRLHWKGVNGFDWSLLAADETGVPALLAILESLPAGHRAIAIAGAGDPQEVETRADVDLRWMPAADIVEAVRALELPDVATYACVAGETDVVRRLRHHLLADRGLPAAHTRFSGYWKRED